MLFAAQQVDVLLHAAAKLATGSFRYVALYTQTFGLSEVVVHQTATIAPYVRIAMYVFPAVCCVLSSCAGLLIYAKIPTKLRIWVTWRIVISVVYGWHAVILGVVLQGGPLGAVEDQLVNGGVSILLALLMLIITLLLLRTNY